MLGLNYGQLGLSIWLKRQTQTILIWGGWSYAQESCKFKFSSIHLAVYSQQAGRDFWEYDKVVYFG